MYKDNNSNKNIIKTKTTTTQHQSIAFTHYKKGQQRSFGIVSHIQVQQQHDIVAWTHYETSTMIAWLTGNIARPKADTIFDVATATMEFGASPRANADAALNANDPPSTARRPTVSLKLLIAGIAIRLMALEKNANHFRPGGGGRRAAVAAWCSGSAWQARR